MQVCNPDHMAGPRLGRATWPLRPLLIAALLATIAPLVQCQKRPNIVLVLTDDQDLLLNSTHPYFMPNLHSMMRLRGLELDQFITSIASCCPSRTTLLTGRYCHNTNVTSNSYPRGGYVKFMENRLDEEYLPVWLQRAGYDTYLIGKLLNGFTEDTVSVGCPRGWTHLDALVQGDMGYNEELYYQDLPLFLTNNCTTKETYPNIFSEVVLREKMLKYLDQAATKENPFFMVVSTVAPHDGYWDKAAVPEVEYKYKDLYPDLQLIKGKNFADPPPRQVGYFWEAGVTTQLDTILSRYRARMQSMRSVDDTVGSLYRRLACLGLLGNTIVMYTSDNGFKLGQHNIAQEKFTQYEEDVRLPFFMTGPGIPRGVKVGMEFQAAMTDITATILQLAGANVTGEPIDGAALPLQDIRAAFTAPNQDWYTPPPPDSRLCAAEPPPSPPMPPMPPFPTAPQSPYPPGVSAPPNSPRLPPPPHKPPSPRRSPSPPRVPPPPPPSPQPSPPGMYGSPSPPPTPLPLRSPSPPTVSPPPSPSSLPSPSPSNAPDPSPSYPPSHTTSPPPYGPSYPPNPPPYYGPQYAAQPPPYYHSSPSDGLQLGHIAPPPPQPSANSTNPARHLLSVSAHHIAADTHEHELAAASAADEDAATSLTHKGADKRAHHRKLTQWRIVDSTTTATTTSSSMAKAAETDDIVGWGKRSTLSGPAVLETVLISRVTPSVLPYDTSATAGVSAVGGWLARGRSAVQVAVDGSGTAAATAAAAALAYDAGVGELAGAHTGVLALLDGWRPEGWSWQHDTWVEEYAEGLGLMGWVRNVRRVAAAAAEACKRNGVSDPDQARAVLHAALAEHVHPVKVDGKVLHKLSLARARRATELSLPRVAARKAARAAARAAAAAAAAAAAEPGRRRAVQEEGGDMGAEEGDASGVWVDNEPVTTTSISSWPNVHLIEAWLDGVFRGKNYRTIRVCTTYQAFGGRAPRTCYKYTVICNPVVKQTPVLTNYELYDLVVDPFEVQDKSPNMQRDVGRYGNFWNRLDVILTVMSYCKGATCRNPFLRVHPDGSVTNFEQAMDPQYDALYNSFKRLEYNKCSEEWQSQNENPDPYLAGYTDVPPPVAPSAPPPVPPPVPQPVQPTTPPAA